MQITWAGFRHGGALWRLGRWRELLFGSAVKLGPAPGWRADGRNAIPCRAENLRIVPVFGKAGLAVTPHSGHVHVTVDDLPRRWADASGEPIIILRLAAGPHRVRIDLVDADRRMLDSHLVEFTVP